MTTRRQSHSFCPSEKTPARTDVPIEAKPSNLIRAVSRWEIVGLSFNDVIGSGVYLLPAAAAALLGVASVWAVLLAGLAVALLVLCFAEAASYFDEEGSAYLYTREAFGDFVGFEVGWMTWLARVASVSALSAGFALALSYLWPAAAEGWARVLVITLLFILLTWVNVVGVKPGARLAVALTIAKCLPLLFFIGVGFFAIDWGRVSPVQMPDAGHLSEAALVLLFAYVGFENTAAAAGEYKNPRRDVPFALLTMIICVTLIYTGVQLVAVGTLPGLAEAESPLAASAATFAGAWAAVLMSVGAIISIGGNAGNTTLLGPRYLFALGEDGYGPRVLARVHPKYRTPAVAIITQSAVGLALALSGSFVALAVLSIVARMATYIGTAAALPVLRRRFPDQPDAIRLPGGYVIPAAALILCIIFLASATWTNLLAGAVALVAGLGIYALRRKRREVDAV